jgi:hypothetical protein
MRRFGWASGKADEEAIAALWMTRTTQPACIRASKTVNILSSPDTGCTFNYSGSSRLHMTSSARRRDLVAAIIVRVESR